MKVAIVSADTMIYRKQKDDTCSPIVRRVLDQVSFKTELVQPVPNDREVIRKILAKIADAQMADLILTIGGIGCREEDCVPEATKAVVDKEIPGRVDASFYDTDQKKGNADERNSRYPG